MSIHNTEKLRIMEDEMNRFESEIGLPNAPVPVHHKPVVIGTNTFSQAERKICEINRFDDTTASKLSIAVGTAKPTPFFIPNQVLQRAHTPRQVIPTSSIQPSLSSSNRDASSIVPFPPLPPGLVFPPRPPSYPFLPPYPFPTPGVNTIINSASDTPGRPMHPMTSMVSHFATRFSKNFVPDSHLSSVSSGLNNAPSKDSETQIILSATPKLYTKPQPDNGRVDKSDEQAAQWNASNDSPAKTTKKQKNSNKDGDYKRSNGEGGYSTGKKKDKKNQKIIRISGGQTWEDPTLTEWEDGDFRLFCGDLGTDVTDELLTRIFSKYPSFLKAKVVRDKRTNKTKGFGFLSFKDPTDFIQAIKEMNGRYVGSRPIKLRKSTWKNRNLDVVKKKEKEKAALISLLTGK